MLLFKLVCCICSLIVLRLPRCFQTSQIMWNFGLTLDCASIAWSFWRRRKVRFFFLSSFLQWNICIYLFYIYLCILYYCNNTTIRTIELGAFFSIDDSAKLTVTSSALLWMDKSLKWASLVTLQSQKALVTEVAILWLWQEYDWNHLSKQFWFYWDLKGSTSLSSYEIT